MLPYAFLRPVHLKCPHCGRQETRMRASAVPGARHLCPYCKKRYVIGKKKQPTAAPEK